jgi:hypothetical protein
MAVASATGVQPETQVWVAMFTQIASHDCEQHVESMLHTALQHTASLQAP